MTPTDTAAGAPRLRRARILGPRLAGNRDFAKLWAAATVSGVGSSVTRLALPTVAILQFRAGAFAVGALTFLGWLPELLLSAVNGVVADRSHRRRLLVVCDIASALAIGSVPLAFATGRLTLGQLFAVQGLAAITANLSDVSFFSFLPGLVGRSALSDANARIETSVQSSVLIGPGLAGLLIEWLSAARAMSVDAVSFVVSAALTRAIRNPGEPAARHADTSPPTFLSDLVAGLRFVFGRRDFRRLALASSLSNAGAAMALAVDLIFAYRNAGLTPGQLGWALTLGAVGAPLAALNAARITQRLGAARTLAMAGVVNGAAFVLMPLALVLPSFVVFAGAWTVFNLPNAVWNVSMSTLRQQLTPDVMLGRMTATTMTLARGSLPLGALVGGALGSAVGVVPTLLVGGVVAMSSAVPLLDPGLRRAASEAQADPV